jgi:hypothetical protein
MSQVVESAPHSSGLPAGGPRGLQRAPWLCEVHIIDRKRAGQMGIVPLKAVVLAGKNVVVRLWILKSRAPFNKNFERFVIQRDFPAFASARLGQPDGDGPLFEINLLPLKMRFGRAHFGVEMNHQRRKKGSASALDGCYTQAVRLLQC